jgi:Outer membrane protein beta-barrel domain
MARLAVFWTTAALLGFATHVARAQESPLGVYVSADIGTATIRQDREPDTGYRGLSRKDFGWDAFVGVRPLAYLGAEIGYLDFGNVHGGYSQGFEVLGHASANAPAAFAVGYLPVQPWWDLYLKVGAARLHRTWDFVPYCPPYLLCPAKLLQPYAGDTSQWDAAWGVGTRWKFGPVALRLQYERVNTNGDTNAGDPDLLSAGVSWTFF